MEELKNCPACGQTEMVSYLVCEDHFLSMEKFNLVQCSNCGLIFTNPRPPSTEIGRYYKSDDYISHSNTKKGILNRVYHVIRKRNHKSKFRIITKHVSMGRLLDIGCATGEFASFFKTRGWEVCGVEPDEDARTFAKEAHNINVYPEDELQKFEKGSFDVITLWHVLEHVPDLGKRMVELHALLNEKGLLVIAVPNPISFDAKYYGSFWAGYDVPRHLYHFSQKSAKKLFEKYGFRCIDVLPMKFDSYYVSLLSEKYKNRAIESLKRLKSDGSRTKWQEGEIMTIQASFIC